MWLTRLLFAWWVRPGTTRSLQAGSQKRPYLIHFPKGYDPRTPTPMVLALHGATMNGPMMAWFSGLNTKADEAGFIVVYPNGTGRHWSFTWNAGTCCGSAVQKNIDDVAFINALLDDLIHGFNVDPQRIYATGMSNGAMMAYRLAGELSNRIAAIAPVSGPMGTRTCQPNRPVPILHFHGTDDEFSPFNGGTGKKSLFRNASYSVEHSIQTWVKLNGCNETPTTDVLSKNGDEMRVTRTTYEAAQNGADVVLVVIEGGGHTWPGKNSPARSLGKSALNISANDLMWEFFQKHKLDNNETVERSDDDGKTA